MIIWMVCSRSGRAKVAASVWLPPRPRQVAAAEVDAGRRPRARFVSDRQSCRVPRRRALLPPIDVVVPHHHERDTLSDADDEVGAFRVAGTPRVQQHAGCAVPLVATTYFVDHSVEVVL